MVAIKERIVMNDGSIVEGGSISKCGEKQIIVTIPGEDIVQATILFGNPARTQKMEAYYSVYKNTYEGFTNVGSVGVDSYEHTVHVYLSGENGTIKNEYTVPEIYLPEAMRTKPAEEENEDA